MKLGLFLLGLAVRPLQGFVMAPPGSTRQLGQRRADLGGLTVEEWFVESTSKKQALGTWPTVHTFKEKGQITPASIRQGLLSALTKSEIAITEGCVEACVMGLKMTESECAEYCAKEVQTMRQAIPEHDDAAFTALRDEIRNYRAIVKQAFTL